MCGVRSNDYTLELALATLGRSAHAAAPQLISESVSTYERSDEQLLPEQHRRLPPQKSALQFMLRLAHGIIKIELPVSCRKH